MDPQRSRPSRGGRRTAHLHFSLASFERKLRGALGFHTEERGCGEPGSTTPDFTGGARRALKSWLFSNLLSKYDDQDKSKGAQRVTAAMEKFWKAEELCFWANLRFAQDDQDICKMHPGLQRAREYIHGLLGQEVPLAELARGFGFSGGASTRLPRRCGDAVYKYSTEVEVTPNALCYGAAAILATPMWKRMFGDCRDDLLMRVSNNTVWGNRVTTVPKNYKTDRVIAVEPCLNMFVQKGLGEVLRRRLKRVGVDLDDQTPNQVAARDTSLATIDFSMASDLISQGIVKFLLPPNWCDLIASLRSEFGVVDGHRIHRYSKVSSMGNGFTFELESLIFWALAAAVTPQDQHDRIRVYGDDVILPTEFAVEFMELSRAAGFIPNADKSFWTGPFRESCGKHYYEGCDISPFYIKRPVKTLSDLFLLHNNLWRWLQRADALLAPEEYSGVKRVLRELRYLAPAQWRKPAIPDGIGDGAFIGSFAECSPQLSTYKCDLTRTRKWDGCETYVANVLVQVPDDGDLIEVPDGGAWVKADNILRSKRWILPRCYTAELQVEPARSSVTRRGRMLVPWWAWG